MAETTEQREQRRRKARERLRSADVVDALLDVGMKPDAIGQALRAEAEFAKADAIDRLSTVLERMLERAEQEDT